MASPPWVVVVAAAAPVWVAVVWPAPVTEPPVLALEVLRPELLLLLVEVAALSQASENWWQKLANRLATVGEC